MKRKTQTAEFRPPMQRITRLNWQNSRGSTSSRETAEIQLTDTEQILTTLNSSVRSALPLDNSEEHQPQCSSLQCADKFPNTNEQELDSGLVGLHSGLEQPNKPNNIEHNVQDGLTSDLKIHPGGAGMEESLIETEDTFSPKRQTSYEAQRRICSLKKTNDDLCVNQEDVSAAIAMRSVVCEESECINSPPKKRLRRRMGMCGLGDRKRKLLIEGQQCRPCPTGTKMEENAEGTDKENVDVLTSNDNLGVENNGKALMNVEETAEPLLVEQNHSNTGQAMHDVQDQPPVSVMSKNYNSETSVINNETNLPGSRKSNYMFSEGSKVNTEGFVDAEIQHGPTGHEMEISVEQKRLSEAEDSVDTEENHGCTDATDKDSNNNSKQTAQQQSEVPKIFASLDVTSDVCEGSTANQLVTMKMTSVCSYVGNGVFYGSTNAPVNVAEKMDYGSTGTCEGSKGIFECLVDAEALCILHHGSTDIEKNHKGSPEDGNEGCVDIDEPIIHGSGCDADICKGSVESTEHTVDETEIYISNSVTEVSEGSKDPAEYPGAKDVSYGTTAVSSEVPKGSNEAPECRVADRGIYDSTSIIEVCEGSRETIECPLKMTEEVSCDSAITNKLQEGPKKTIEQLTEEVSCTSFTVTYEVGASFKDLSEHPVHAVQVSTEMSNGDVALTKKACEGPEELTETDSSIPMISNDDSEGSVELTGHPVVTVLKEKSYGCTAVTSEVSECLKESTERPSQLAEEESYGSTPVTDQVFECSRQPTEHLAQMTEEVIYGTTAVTNGLCEGSREVTKHLVQLAEKENYGSTVFTNKASEVSIELTGHPAQIVGKVCYDLTAISNKACEDSLEPIGHPALIAEKVSYGCTTITSDVCEGSLKVSKEVQEAITTLEENETELDGHCPSDDITHLFSPFFNLARVEHVPSELQLSMQTDIKLEPICMDHTVSTEAGLAEICETGCQFGHMELTQVPTKAAAVSTEPGGRCCSRTERLRGPEAPPADQQTRMHELQSQDICDLPVTPAVAKQPVCHPTLTLALTQEFSQDHNNIPSSFYSVTDSQLNSITLGMELEDRSTEGFAPQEDATELVCGLIKELSSLNRMVMAAHKEMDILRWGNRPSVAPIQRKINHHTRPR